MTDSCFCIKTSLRIKYLICMEMKAQVNTFSDEWVYTKTWKLFSQRPAEAKQGNGFSKTSHANRAAACGLKKRFSIEL